MNYSNLGKTLFILSALFLSVSVFGQGRGGGNGSGQGGGREHKETPGKKKTYLNVAKVEVYAANGTSIYPVKTKKSGGSKGSVVPEIQKVEKSQNGIRIYFAAKNDDQRVVELLCKDCILLVDHTIVRGAETDR